MGFTTDFSTYSIWSGYATLAFFVLSIIAFLAGWGFRFRLVGITGFMMVLTAGLFGLGLGLFNPVAIPGAVRYALVYDNGGNQTVITVENPITPSEVEATLQQAANDLFSYGRAAGGEDPRLTIRLRTLIHPEEGMTVPLYLGEVKRSLKLREDTGMQVTIFSDKFAQLPKG